MAHQLLQYKKGIIFGALNEDSLAWQVAEKAHEEGAQLILTNTQVALRLGNLEELAEKTGSGIIPADASSLQDIENLLKETMNRFNGKVDFILHSIGMSPNVRKGREYDDLNYEYFLKTLDVSALSFHKILQTAWKMDAINEWGSVVALSYIAAQRTLDKYNDMGDAKALLESIARSFGYIYGQKRKVRINTVSQSPTATTAGKGIHGFEDLVDFTERMSPLGNAGAEECAGYIVTLFSDLTRKVTMQNLYHDGGFSSMAMNERAMSVYNRSRDCECHADKGK